MPSSDRYLHRAASQVPYFSADADAYFAPTPLRDLKKSLPLRVLTEDDFDSWQT
jgi:hypothetical protein